MPKNHKRIAIMQPGYLPWLGFFELMANCDLFIFLDDVQYTKRDWRNRNRIRTNNGWQWLSVPVFNKNKREQLIKDVQINNQEHWQKQHLGALKINYNKSKFFGFIFPELEDIYAKGTDKLLDLNLALTGLLAKKLSIQTPCLFSSEFKIKSTRTQRVLEICRLLKADELYDSMAAADFLDLALFEQENIKVKFQNYIHPVYNQVYKPFIPYMSALDLLFNYGKDALPVINSKSQVL
jgi:hypothetical protein